MITCEVNGHIATLTLNRPDKLHALTPEMLQLLDSHAAALDQREDVRVVLLTATGKAFCVGADIHAWTSLEPLAMWRSWIRAGHRVFDRLASLRQPVIAVLNGYTLGGGLELALTADIRLAADHARLGQPEVKLGTVPGWGGTERLTRAVGAARAKQMIFSGEQIDAHTALSWGLVNEVCAADALAGRATALAESIAANAPLAVQFAKQAIDHGGGATLEALAGALAATTHDAQEGKLSFQERRTAIFTGK
jgi:enoyl-CoA hydratase/carnithine racemase